MGGLGAAVGYRSVTKDDPTPSDAEIDVESNLLSDDEVSEIEEAEPEAEPVTYTGTDFDVEGLVRRLGRGDIVVPNFGHDDITLELAGFQRAFIWRRSQMDRFIESLLLGFPIPGIMLVEQADKRYLVLDGQQRLKTLAAFYKGIHLEKVFSLQNVADEYKNLTYETLAPAQRRTIDNTFISATIVRNDGSRKSLDSIYQVFERLNAGGTQLTPHEIRIALYSGQLVEFLAELNTAAGWREIYGPVSPRLRDQELILRILAFYSRSAEYKTPLKKFLNDFLADHRNLTKLPRDEIERLFRDSTQALADSGTREVLRRAGSRINAALLESVVVAAMRRLADGGSLDAATMARANAAIIDDQVLARATASGTTFEANVKTRLQRASAAFDA